MTARRTLLLASAAALMSVPAWAVSSAASTGHGLGHGLSGTAPGQSKDADEHGSHGSAPTGHPGSSHKCKAHSIAYVVSGTLEKQTLVKNEDGTYSGEIALKSISRTNHHAKGAKSPFTVAKVHVTFGLADTNSDGSVGLDDLKEGDSVKLIGKITSLAKKCDHTGFEAKVTIRRVIFTAPSTP